MNHLLRNVVKSLIVFILVTSLCGWIYSMLGSLHMNVSSIRYQRLWAAGYALLGAAILWWPFRRYAAAPWIGLAQIGAGVIPVLFAFDGISLVALVGWIAAVFLARAWLELTTILKPASVLNAGGPASVFEPVARTASESKNLPGVQTICLDQIVGRGGIEKGVPHPGQVIIRKSTRPVIVFVDKADDVLRHGQMLGADDVPNVVVVAIDLADEAVRGVFYIAAADSSDSAEEPAHGGQFEQQTRLDIAEGEDLAAYVRTRIRVLAGDVFAISRYTMELLVDGLRGCSLTDADAVMQRVIDKAAIRQLREGSATITVADAKAALGSISRRTDPCEQKLSETN
jgi:hypothetical protein